MTRSALLTVVFLSIVTVVFAQGPQLSLDSTKIQVGQSVRLRWSIGKAAKAYVSGVGKVTSDGAQLVSPDKTITYTLIAEGKFGTVYKAITLEVEGAKGGDPDESSPPTDYKAFKYPLSTKHKVSSYVDFLNQIHLLLQNDMKFSVYGPFPSPSGNTMFFVTNFKRRGDMVKLGEKTIAERKISYLVEIERASTQECECALTIKALVKYRKARESTWRDEGYEEFYRPGAEDLKKGIDSLPKK